MNFDLDDVERSFSDDYLELTPEVVEVEVEEPSFAETLFNTPIISGSAVKMIGQTTAQTHGQLPPVRVIDTFKADPTSCVAVRDAITDAIKRGIALTMDLNSSSSIGKVYIRRDIYDLIMSDHIAGGYWDDIRDLTFGFPHEVFDPHVFDPFLWLAFITPTDAGDMAVVAFHSMTDIDYTKQSEIQLDALRKLVFAMDEVNEELGLEPRVPLRKRLFGRK